MKSKRKQANPIPRKTKKVVLPPPAVPIPIHGSISFEDWMAGRERRRAVSNLVAPKMIRRKKSSSDRRLKKLYKGKRGLPF